MTQSAGFQKFGWDCEKEGCFNVKKRLDFGAFYDCFPHKVSMSDIDGVVEIAGHILLFEAKQDTKPLKVGQRLMFERLSGLYSIHVFVAAGGGADMTFTHLCEFWHGKQGPWVECDLDYIRGRLKAFSEFAKAHPNLPGANRSVITPEAIRAWRKARGLSQTELADALGVTWRTVSNWERGASIPRMVGLALRGLGDKPEEESR